MNHLYTSYFVMENIIQEKLHKMKSKTTIQNTNNFFKHNKMTEREVPEGYKLITTKTGKPRL